MRKTSIGLRSADLAAPGNATLTTGPPEAEGDTCVPQISPRLPSPPTLPLISAHRSYQRWRTKSEVKFPLGTLSPRGTANPARPGP